MGCGRFAAVAGVTAPVHLELGPAKHFNGRSRSLILPRRSQAELLMSWFLPAASLTLVLLRVLWLSSC